MEHLKIITQNTLIPIGLVALLVGGIFYLGRTIQRVDFNETALGKVQEQIKDVPNRNEFQTLQEDVKEIKTDIKTILKNNKR